MLRCQEEQLEIFRAQIVDGNIIAVSWQRGEDELVGGSRNEMRVCISVQAIPKSETIIAIHVRLDELGISPKCVQFSTSPEPCVFTITPKKSQT
jgi:hypothetical protein